MPSIDPVPVKIDYTQYMSIESKNRKRSQLKELRPYFEIPGMISVSLSTPRTLVQGVLCSEIQAAERGRAIVGGPFRRFWTYDVPSNAIRRRWRVALDGADSRGWRRTE